VTHLRRVWFRDRVCAIGELICDTPVHKGQWGITMATTFGTNIAINACPCISTKDNENAITYNRGLSWSAYPKKTFLFSGVYEKLPRQPNFGQNRQKYHKTGHSFSCIRHMHAEFGFEIGLCYCGIHL